MSAIFVSPIIFDLWRMIAYESGLCCHGSCLGKYSYFFTSLWNCVSFFAWRGFGVRYKTFQFKTVTWSSVCRLSKNSTINLRLLPHFWSFMPSFAGNHAWTFISHVWIQSLLIIWRVHIPPFQWEFCICLLPENNHVKKVRFILLRLALFCYFSFTNY